MDNVIDETLFAPSLSQAFALSTTSCNDRKLEKVLTFEASLCINTCQCHPPLARGPQTCQSAISVSNNSEENAQNKKCKGQVAQIRRLVGKLQLESVIWLNLNTVWIVRCKHANLRRLWGQKPRSRHQKCKSLSQLPKSPKTDAGLLLGAHTVIL